MSIKSRFGDKYEKLSEILQIYEEDLQGINDNLRIEGKSVERANLEQAQWVGYYAERRVELKRIAGEFEAERNRVRYTLFKNSKTNLEMSDSLRLKYIEQEEVYMLVNSKYLTIMEMHNKYAAAGESFNQRGYALRNLTQARVASVYSEVLDG